MRRTHYLRNAMAGLFILMLVVGLELFAHSSAQTGCLTVPIAPQTNCISNDGTTCKYSFTLNVTNNTAFTGQATIQASGGTLTLISNPNLHFGSGNIITGTVSVACGTPGMSLTLSFTGCSLNVPLALRRCSCTVTATAGDQTICKGATTQINLPSTPSGNISWYYSSPCASPIPSSGIVPAGWSALPGGTTASSMVTPLQTTCYQAVVANMLNCPGGTGVSNLITVNVVNPSSPGSIACTVGGNNPCPTNGEICDGSTVSLTDPNTPGPNCSRQWYQWIGSVWQPITGATGQTLTPTLTSSICPFVPAKFRVVYSCPHCPDNFSEISFKVYSKSVGGTITAPPICDDAGDILTLAGECGDIVQWESSPSGLPGTFNAISGSGGAHTWSTNQILPHHAYYQVRVHNGPCGVAYSPVFHVALNHKPNPTITAGGQPTSFCAPGSVPLTATNPNGGTCEWYRNGLATAVFGMTYSATASGNYYVVCTDNVNQCGKTKSNFIKVRADKPVAVIQGPCSVCLPNSVHLNAVPGGGVLPYTFLWSTGQTSQAINPSPATNQTYTLTVTDAMGCHATATHSVDICPEKVVASAGPNITTCPGGQVTIGGSPTASLGTGPYSYSWSPAIGLSNTTIANPTASPSQTTTYTVTVTDSTGCVSKATVIVTVKGPPCAKPSGENFSILRLFFGLESQLDLTKEIPWRTMRFASSANVAARR